VFVDGEVQLDAEIGQTARRVADSVRLVRSDGRRGESAPTESPDHGAVGGGARRADSAQPSSARERVPIVHGPHPQREGYDRARFDAACRRALAIGAPTRKSVLAILSRGLETTELADADPAQLPLPVHHENVHGGDYYDQKETEPS
jgi:hypothetical protein